MASLDPCEAGCAENVVSERPPTTADDGCNTNNTGYLCVGSTWTYDPTLPGADTATNGDCTRMWINLNGECNLAEWLEISVENYITDTVAPVDGVDCCPPGTIWCVPAAGDITENQTWINVGDCGGDCVWCRLCGRARVISAYNEVNPGAPLVIIPEGVLTVIPNTEIQLDTFGAHTPAIGTNTFTVPHTGCYELHGWIVGRYTGPNMLGSIIRLGVLVNGVLGPWIGQAHGMELFSRVPPDDITFIAQGSSFICRPAGDTLQLVASWDTALGGTDITVALANFSIIEVPR